MTWIRCLVLLAFLGSLPVAHAGPVCESGGGPGLMGHRPAFLDEVFPPGLVMRNQSDIGLTAAQREAITRAMADAQKALVEVRWEFEAEAAKLEKLLAASRIDDAAALAQAERVMILEQRMKKTHLALLIKIKNELEPGQQEKLRTLRRSRRDPPGSEPPRDPMEP